MHLGYLSASVIKTNQQPYAGTLAFVSLGMIIAVMIIWRILGRVLIVRRVAQSTLLLGIALLLMNGALNIFGPWHYENPQAATRTHLDYITTELDGRDLRGLPLPDDLASLQFDNAISVPTVGSDFGNMDGYDNILFIDGWRRPFRYRKVTYQQRKRYELASAGPDGKFDTADDIVGGGKDNKLYLRLLANDQRVYDAWGSLSMRQFKKNNRLQCEIRSNGLDKIAGTKDDVIWTYFPPELNGSMKGER